MLKHLLALVIAVLILIAPAAASADGKFHVVLQISDDSVDKQTLVLNVADNLKHDFGEKLDLKIVAFGPGLNLLLANNRMEKRLLQLSRQGIKLIACRNTADKMEKLTGREIRVAPNVEFTPGGASLIVSLVKSGYVLIRP